MNENDFILALAAEIRRVDGSHNLGAAALAEALVPFLTTALPLTASGQDGLTCTNGPDVNDKLLVATLGRRLFEAVPVVETPLSSTKWTAALLENDLIDKVKYYADIDEWRDDLQNEVVPIGILREVTQPAAPSIHPDTAEALRLFVAALTEKLAANEQKYGYTNQWKTNDWEQDCKAGLIQHLHKGDPRDVAIYALFMWARGWDTKPAAPEVPGELVEQMYEAIGKLGDRRADVPESVWADWETEAGKTCAQIATAHAERETARLRAVAEKVLNSFNGDEWLEQFQVERLTMLRFVLNHATPTTHAPEQ